MIENIIIGDIISPKNTSDIIIGMNTSLDDVTGIGLRFVRDIIPAVALELGSVISFDFDATRKLHMIICHELGVGGWRNADHHVRYGMDYLGHMNDGKRDHSIVEIGTGRIGRRDGAKPALIRSAMATSFLSVDLYVFDGAPMEAIQEERVPLRALYAWTPSEGRIKMAA